MVSTGVHVHHGPVQFSVGPSPTACMLPTYTSAVSDRNPGDLVVPPKGKAGPEPSPPAWAHVLEFPRADGYYSMSVRTCSPLSSSCRRALAATQKCCVAAAALALVAILFKQLGRSDFQADSVLKSTQPPRISPPKGLDCVDFVMVTNAPLDSCVLLASVNSLWRYAQPRPCRILLVSAGRCNNAPRDVHCLHEATLIPGLSISSVRDALARHPKPKKGELPAETLKARAGWLLQQFLKLGLAEYKHDLTEHFVIWDSDCVILRPLAFFDEDLRSVVRMHGANTLANRDKLVPYKPQAVAAETGASRHPPVPPGISHMSELGAVTPSANFVAGSQGCDYAWVFHQLTGGLPLIVPSHSRAHVTSFVTHYMATRRSTVNTMTQTFARVGAQQGAMTPGIATNASAKDGLPPWMAHALRVVRDKCGFTEYGSMVSWTLQRAPEQLRLVRERDWVRVPHMNGICPTYEALRPFENLSYVGWEQNGGVAGYGGGTQSGWQFELLKRKNELRRWLLGTSIA